MLLLVWGEIHWCCALFTCSTTKPFRFAALIHASDWLLLEWQLKLVTADVSKAISSTY